MSSRYYDVDGNPLEMLEWAAKFEGRGDPTDHSWKIGFDEEGDVSVSTVWLGLDHQYGDGPPLIFETMIFGGEHDQYQERYSTKEEAIAGHKRACALAFGGVLATYTLQLIGPAIPSIVASPQNFAHMLRETEENLTDLLPEGFSARIKEWDDE